MNTILRMLEPRSRLGVLVRFVLYVSLIGIANGAFTLWRDWQAVPLPVYLVAHAVLVGGPFTAFFFFMLMQQVRLQKQLSRLSRMDGLTGLNNRRSFMEMAQRLMQNSDGGALLLIDADHFKKINDTYGHQAGDKCLKSIAHAMMWNLRETDIAGRIGGEEFAVFLANATPAQVRTIGARLTKPIPFSAGSDDRPLTVTLSVGAAPCCDGCSLDDLFHRADHALYQAKALGRARVVIWDETQESPGFVDASRAVC